MGSIGENIRNLREKAGMTQEQLSEAIGVNRVTLAKYEADKSAPGAKILSKYSLCF